MWKNRKHCGLKARRIAVGIALLGALLAGGHANAAWNPGDVLPNLAEMGIEGSLPATTGRVVIVDFWASWCVPCKESFPALDALARQYQEQGLVVLGIGVDEKADDMKRFRQANPVSFPLVWDAAHRVVEAAAIEGMPTSYIIDRRGRIRFVHAGFHGEKTLRAYREQVEKLLNEGAGGS